MRRRKLRLGILLQTMVVLMMVGCKPQTVVYHHYEHAATTGWEKDDTLFFKIPPSEVGGVFAEDVELRTNNDYPFMGISLIVKQVIFPSMVSRADTIFCTLAEEDGTITGKGINYYQHRFPLKDISLNEGDSVVISIRHNMIRETLPGIIDVGIRLSKQ